MNRPVVAIVAGFGALLVASCLWVPCVPRGSAGGANVSASGLLVPWDESAMAPHWREYVSWKVWPFPADLHLRWIGSLDRWLDPSPKRNASSRQPDKAASFMALAACGPASVHLPTLLAWLLLVLALGGLALTGTLRRQRRLPAAS